MLTVIVERESRYIILLSLFLSENSFYCIDIIKKECKLNIGGNNMIELSTDKFSYDKKERMFYSEISTLNCNLLQCLY